MRATIRFRDHHREGQIFNSRLIWSVVFVAAMTIGLVSRMLWLQWAQHDRFASLADQNRIQTQAIAPPRGLILDRNGEVLAENRPDFSLNVVPEQTRDMTALLSRVSELIDLDDNDRERFNERLGNRRRPWEPVPLRGRMTESEIAVIAASLHELPGLRISAEAIRHYPHGELLSHVIGYVNRINEKDLAAMSEDTLANYSGTYFYGRTGIERAYEDLLHGQVGYRHAETNARGRLLDVLDEQPPRPGVDLRTHIDLEVQKTAWDALGDRRGAVVAIDPRNGGILAFVSRPGFDPNLFVTGISVANYDRYRTNYDKPLFNRAIQGQYPPGSTIKQHLGLAGLQAGVTTWKRTIKDPGVFSLPDNERVYRDWKKGGHGDRINLKDAIEQSCDIYYYDMGVRMGIDFMHDFMVPFGFGRTTGVDIPGEQRGIMPSRDWKRGARGSAWFHGDTVNASIGQGYFLATPLQLAVSSAIIARRGEQFTPRIANVAPPQNTQPDVVLKNDSDWERMNDAMEAVVHGKKGTARGIGYRTRYRIAGKTGTAQVFSVPEDEEYNAEELEERLLDHALFVAHAPADDPAIAIAVLVENGEHGSTTAAPIARAVMDAWLLDDNGNVAVPTPLELN